MVEGGGSPQLEKRVDRIDSRLSYVENNMSSLKEDISAIKGNVGHLKEDVGKISKALLGNGKVEEGLAHRFVQIEYSFSNIRKIHWAIAGAVAVSAAAVIWKLIAYFIREGII